MTTRKLPRDPPENRRGKQRRRRRLGCAGAVTSQRGLNERRVPEMIAGNIPSEGK